MQQSHINIKKDVSLDARNITLSAANNLMIGQNTHLKAVMVHGTALGCFRGEKVKITSEITSGNCLLEGYNHRPGIQVTPTPISGDAPLSVNFVAKVTDEEKSTAEVRWNFDDDSEEVMGTEVTHIFKARAIPYNVLVVVTDADGSEAFKFITIESMGKPPVPSFSASTTNGYAPLEVSFDGNMSNDPDGNIVRYHWDFGDGTTRRGQISPIHLYPDIGTYTVTLEVEDNDGYEKQVTKTIIVSKQPQVAPIMLGDDSFSVVENEEITFTLKGAEDANNDDLYYSQVGSIPNSQGVLSDCLKDTSDLECLFTPAKDFTGTVSFFYRANDGSLNSTTNATVTITVTQNNIPVANISSVASVKIGRIIDLNGSASTDQDGSELSYRWTLKSRPQDSRTILGMPNFKMANLVPDKSGNYIIELVVNDGQDDSPTASLTLNVPENKEPVFTGLSDKTLTLGNTLSFVVGASDQDNDKVSLFSLNIPEGASFDSDSGIFKWRPTSSQTGMHKIIFRGNDGLSGISKEITITVNEPAPNTPTGLTGRVIDSNSMAQGIILPIQGVRISVSDSTLIATTDSNGYFTLSNIPSGRIRASFDSTASTGPKGVKYANFHGMINLTANTLNNTGRAFMLPRIDPDGMAEIERDKMTMVENPNLGVSVEVAANSVQNPDGTSFTGTLSLSDVPPSATPAQLPEQFSPSRIITLQPAGLVFTTPARVTFPNTENYAPGSEVEIYSLDSTQGRFYRSGKGRVTEDGSKIETIEGGLRDSSWHFSITPEIRLATLDRQGPGVTGIDLINLDEGLIEKSDDNANLTSGKPIAEPQEIASNDPCSSCAYNGETAFGEKTLPQRPILQFNQNVPIPDRISIRVEVDGVRSSEIFFDSSHFTMSPHRSREFTLPAVVKTDGLETGIYEGYFIIKQYFTGGSSREGIIPPAGMPPLDIVIVKTDKSAFGTGWSYRKLHRIYFKSNNRFSNKVLLTFGNGSSLTFSKRGNFYNSPSGDYSRLEIKSTGWIRTLKDGFKYYFNSLGYLTSTVDRNGNTTSYHYDNDWKIIKIINPVGRETRFVYGSDGMIDSITYPTGRTVTYEHDSDKNLMMITRPDNTQVMFNYADKGRISSQSEMIDGEMSTHNYVYNAQWGISRTNRGDGSTTKLSSVITSDFKQREGTMEDPIPLPTMDEVQKKIATSEDAKGNKTQTVLNEFGTEIEEIDAMENKSSIVRDHNNNPTTTIDKRGVNTFYSYDTRGNLLSSTIDGDTTRYTYESFFNQVTRIDYPDGTNETFTYDTKGNLLEHTNQRKEKFRYKYNNRGQVTTSIDSLDRKTQTLYDDWGRVKKTISYTGQETSYLYDNADNIIAVTDSRGHTTRRTFDLAGRVLTQTDPLGAVTTFTYTEDGQIKTLTDANDNKTTFSYDAQKRLVKKEDSLGRIETFSYDGAGNLTESMDRNGNTFTYAYDALNRLVKKETPDDTIYYSYDQEGNLIKVTDDDSNISYTYTDKSQVLSKTIDHKDGIPITFNYRYDDLGRRILMRNSFTGKTQFYTYDDVGRIQNIGRFRFIYDSNGRPTKTILPNELVSTYDYDEESRIASLTVKKRNTNLISQALTYDKNNNLSKITRDSGVSILNSALSYTYNNRDELLTATHPLMSGTNEIYTYDNLGNRQTRQGQTVSSTFNTLNQLIDDGDYTYAYDNNGNQTRRIDKTGGEIVDFQWSAENRLVEINEMPSLSGSITKTITFRYDAEGRRISKTVGDKTLKYVYDEDNIILHLNGENKIIAEFTHGIEIDSPLIMIRDSKTYYYHRDYLGSVIALSDTDGNIVQQYAYDSFGNVVFIDKDGDKTHIPSIENPFTYTSREWDEDAKMYYYRARWFNPEIGRFISEDPIGVNVGLSSLDYNLYSYVRNNPLNYVDSDGETPKHVALLAFGVGVGIGAIINKIAFDIDVSETISNFNPFLTLVDEIIPGTSLLVSKEGQTFVKEIVRGDRAKRQLKALDEAVKTGTSKQECENSN